MSKLKALAAGAAFAAFCSLSAWAGSSSVPMLIVKMQSSSAPTISNVTLNGGNSASYQSGINPGSSVGQIVVTTSDSSNFTGSVSLTGTAAADFTATKTSLNANGSTPTCTSTTTLNLNIVATPGAGERGAQFTLPVYVTCNPSQTTIACAIGPSYSGPVPGPAMAAGFTTCIANLDFTSSEASNINNWLQCPNNKTNTNANNGGQAWLIQNGTGGNTSDAPCSDFSIITDGSNGQVYDMTFTPSDQVNNVQYAVNHLNYSFAVNQGTTLPQSIFIDSVMRTPQSTYNNVANVVTVDKQNDPGSGCCVVSALFADTFVFNGPWTEWDFIELAGTQTDGYGNLLEFGGSTGGGGSDFYINWPSFDSTVYNEYSSLDTVDSSGNTAKCEYLNKVAANNGCASGFQDSNAQNQRNDLALFSGGIWPGSQSWTQPTITGNIDTYWKSVTIWSCSSWRTTGCPVPTITNPPSF